MQTATRLVRPGADELGDQHELMRQRWMRGLRQSTREIDLGRAVRQPPTGCHEGDPALPARSQQTRQRLNYSRRFGVLIEEWTDHPCLVGRRTLPLCLQLIEHGCHVLLAPWNQLNEEAG